MGARACTAPRCAAADTPPCRTGRYCCCCWLAARQAGWLAGWLARASALAPELIFPGSAVNRSSAMVSRPRRSAVDSRPMDSILDRERPAFSAVLQRGTGRLGGWAG